MVKTRKSLLIIRNCMDKLILLLILIHLILGCHTLSQNSTVALLEAREGIEGSVVYNAYFNGSVLVTIVLSLHGELKVTLPLEGQVKTGSIIVLDEQGLPLPYDQNGTNITIYSLNSSKVTLIYVSYKLIAYSNGVWSLHVKPILPPTIILPENSILLKYTGSPQIRAENGRIILRYNTEGDYKVYFTSALPPTLTITNTTIVKMETSPTTTTTIPTTTKPGGLLLDNLMLPIVISIIIFSIAVLLYYFKYRRPTTTIILSEDFLDERDREILKTLETKKTITLSELTRTLNISKSTVWRRIQKLQKLGFIQVERVAGKLVIKAKKKE